MGVHKTKARAEPAPLERSRKMRLSDLRLFSAAMRIAQHIAAAPDGLDIVGAVGGGGQLLAQLADEDVDDLELWLVHAAIEMVEEHLLGQGGALPQRKQLQHLVF